MALTSQSMPSSLNFFVMKPTKASKNGQRNMSFSLSLNDDKTTKKTGLKIDMRVPSKKADAVCHRERMSHNETFEFLQKKLYLGRDTRHKLALIAQVMTGTGFNPRKFDAEKAADVISACVNHMYNDIFTGNDKNTIAGMEEHPKITAATCQRSMNIYSLYQLVRGRFDKLWTGDTDREKYDSVAETLNEFDINKPKVKALSAGPKWTRSDIAWMCNIENVNRCIERNNKKYASPKPIRNDTEQ